MADRGEGEMLGVGTSPPHWQGSNSEISQRSEVPFEKYLTSDTEASRFTVKKK